MKKVFFCLMMLAFTGKLAAQNYQLHAVYMYQFIKYINWPAGESTGDFVIGVLGDSPITEHLNKMAETKKIGSRKIVIKEFDNIAQITNTQMLFVGKDVVEEVAPVLEKINGQHTLLITEEEGFGLEGSNINFIERKGRLVFELNRNAMDRESLQVSSELAKLAIVI